MDNGRSQSVGYTTDELRIKEIKELSPPSHVIREFACTDKASQTVHDARNAVHASLHRMDDRLVVVIGPCSIHDVEAAREYAQRLAEERARLGAELEIVMRLYFEKTPTTAGWKWL